MKKHLLSILPILPTLVLISLLGVVFGQVTNVKNDHLLVEKYEKAIKGKEPRYKQSYKSKRKEHGDRDYTTLEWTRAGDFVHIETIRLDSDAEAANWLHNARNVPVAVVSPTTKLADLGDEAYIEVSTNNYTQMHIRKGDVYIRLNASSPKLAKRFARHLVNSIDS